MSTNHHKEKYYCGAWWVPRFIRKILSYKFNASCKIHDLHYEEKTLDREEADVKFLLNMIRQSKGNVFYEFCGTLFYIFVRVLGKISWRRNKKK